ncbi:hypothetical protein ATI61_1291 [Archangium gephyra]|uniref:DUF676 domain-containing protein n=1 Tax=Archangium gephyra TaxID=48 RepID=A0AAC8TJU6_9BACT|nr:hypothetical protein [Archangium gephyra]AKJ08340.1 Hypothetical protein AA314_09966 [Archangium gephyra]REG14260.1 hypothetical protein ATI61_1291 [Archangium gephyra]
MTSIHRNVSAFNPASTATARTGNERKSLNPLEKVVDLAKSGLADVPRFVKMGLDVFESAHVAELNRLFGGDAKPDRLSDGKFVGTQGQTFPPGTALGQIPGVTPKNNPNPSETILYVNGIMTPLDGQLKEMQSIADTSGAKVVGIHNATQGLVTDLAQCVTDKLDKGSNPAVDTLADTLYSELKAGRDVHLMGYSQGGLITARALFDVEQRLRLEDGLSKAQTEQLMSHLKVETFGAASTKYPDGPQYVHYVNNADPVPTLTGLGGSVDPLDFLKDAGKGAVVHRFTDGNLNPISNHMLDTLYMKHRVSFDEARAGHF